MALVSLSASKIRANCRVQPRMSIVFVSNRAAAMGHGLVGDYFDAFERFERLLDGNAPFRERLQEGLRDSGARRRVSASAEFQALRARCRTSSSCGPPAAICARQRLLPVRVPAVPAHRERPCALPERHARVLEGLTASPTSSPKCARPACIPASYPAACAS